VRQDARSAGLQGESKQIADGVAGGRVVGRDEAAHAAPEHRVDGDVKIFQPGKDTDVRRAPETARTQDERDASLSGRLAAASRHGTNVLMVTLPWTAPRIHGDRVLDD